ncbi:GLPGLI family protein [Zunongwangia endophytica]|uniref:GLPGLI family protein n=1 Tax=Zunongwangia endophytica TaxID=1808945 RepID=UPI0025B2D916|nr:GLPGLI family protein [Zunongwangia endophytica]MDN3595788.1 GLPGLI family protein [Zunongwangia endophytica]
MFFKGQNGYAYYKKRLLNDANKENVNSKFQKAIKMLHEQDFILSFNTQNALFKKVDNMSIETNKSFEAYTRALSGFTGQTYFDRRKKNVIHKKEFLGNFFLINKKKINWTLTKEQLKISSFECYKAVAKETINSPTGFHEIDLIAWYAPDISLPYGPDGYGGLPGLIICLKNNGRVTTLKKIELLNDKELVNINFILEGKYVTENEYDKMVIKAFENRF